MKIHINFVTIFRDINSMSLLILFISVTSNILKHINKILDVNGILDVNIQYFKTYQ
jgi:hypothetical protein